MPEGKHTPTPYCISQQVNENSNDVLKIVTDEYEPWFIATICQDVAAHGKVDGEEERANAEFLVRACNSHAALVDACEGWKEVIEHADIRAWGAISQIKVNSVIAKTKAALALAKEGE